MARNDIETTPDSQGPGATGWYRAAIGAQGDLGAGGKPMFHLCHSTGLPHEKLSDLNVEVLARQSPHVH